MSAHFIQYFVKMAKWYIEYILVKLLPLLEKMDNLEETMESLTSRVEKVEQQLMLKAFQYYIPTPGNNWFRHIWHKFLAS